MTTEPNGTGTPKRAPAADVVAARAELTAALDAIQDKLNVPKRIRRAAEQNPVALAGVGLVVAVVVAGAVWLVVRRLRAS